MATTANKRTDSTPVDGSLATFLKEADQNKVDNYRLDLGKGKRITFKSPDEIGTKEFLDIFGGGLAAMGDEQAVAYFLNHTLSPGDREAYLSANPPMSATMLILDAVRDHYQDQVPTSGESPASSH